MESLETWEGEAMMQLHNSQKIEVIILDNDSTGTFYRHIISDLYKTKCDINQKQTKKYEYLIMYIEKSQEFKLLNLFFDLSTKSFHKI